MTIGSLKERLRNVKHDFVQYRTFHMQLSQREKDRHTEQLCTELERVRDKLLQEYRQLEEAIAALSEGPFRIEFQTGKLTNLYLEALSARPEPWQIDAVIMDLEQIITTLASRPSTEPLRRPPIRMYMQSGVLEASTSIHTPSPPAEAAQPLETNPLPAPTVRELLTRLSTMFQHRIASPHDRSALQQHIQAILDHPGAASVLSAPVAELL